MMRGRRHWAVAVRRPNGAIHVEGHEINSLADRYPLLSKPGFRGVMALGQAVTIGVRALTISANQSVEDEERLNTRQIAGSMALAFTFFVAVFIVGPYLGFRLIATRLPSTLLRNLLEGLLRVGLFLGYLALVGRMREIRRVFQYHGAEHKTIYAYENGDELVPAEIDERYPTLHVRCGTNFLFIVLFLAIVTNFLIDLFWGGSLLPRVGLRLLAIPVLAGLSYEVIKLASRNEGSWLFKASMLPGLALQRITTKPPTHDMIEVAIAAMVAVAPKDPVDSQDEAPSAPVA